MIIHKGFKTQLKLNNKQKTACAKGAGTARFAYNWGLNKKIEAYKETGKSPSSFALHRELNVLKAEEFPWMYEVSKCAPHEALRDLDIAYNNFYRRVKAGADQAGFPRFKSRHNGLGSFRLNGTIKVKDKTIQLPRLGVLRLYEKDYLPTQGVDILSATVSEKAGKWFVSVQCRYEAPNLLAPKSTEIIGIDLGIKTLATCSDAKTFANPKALKAKTKRLKFLQKRLSRCKKGSKNRAKARRKVSKLHVKISNIRKDATHKATSEIVAQRPTTIVLEDLNIKGMVKNHKLAKAISDANMSEFKRQIQYKAEWSGIDVIFADRFFPSSKLCSACGNKKTDLKLSDRIYKCPECGFTLDRDLNAALNLRKLGQVLSEETSVEMVSFSSLAGAVAVCEAETKQQMTTFV